jgi:hypothetical protein
MMNEKEFRSIYNNYLESGLTLRDFCANQGILESKFFYWQNKLKGLLPPKRGFVPVIFSGNQQDPSPILPAALNNHPERQIKQASSIMSLTCEISYPNGIRVKVNGLADLEMVRTLLVSAQR